MVAMKITAVLVSVLCLGPDLLAGIDIHPNESPFQNGRQEIRVLLPDTYTSNKQYRVLYVLPVGAGGAAKPAKDLNVLKEMNAHNAYDLIIVALTFEKIPWFGDHPTEPKTRQASYVMEWVVPFVESHYSTLRSAEGRLLFGFSKSGWGAFSLILRNPDFFGYAAAWDAPMMLADFHYGMDGIFGNLEQLAAYRPDLLVVKQKGTFQSRTRLVFAGENKWGNLVPSPAGGTHTTDFHRLLQREQVKHVFLGDLDAPHAWSKDWMAPTLAALMRAVSDSAGSETKRQSSREPAPH